MLKRYCLIIFFIFSLCLSKQVFANVTVIDGDTIKLDDQKIRLYGLDAPELKQKCLDAKNIEWDCGKCAKAFLEGMLAISQVTCEQAGDDKYNRMVGICFVNGKEINKALVKAGHAIAYKQYSQKYSEDEDYARTHKLGMWAGQFIAPSEYRIQLRAKNLKKKQINNEE